MTWARGEELVRRLLRDGGLQHVQPSSQIAQRLLSDAVAHVSLGRRGVGEDVADEFKDPAGALQLGYDAARKASAALLAMQGLRATTRGGHVAVLKVVREQFNGPAGEAVFGRTDRYRRRRHDSEYPDASSPGVTEADAVAALDHADDVIRAVGKIVDSGQLDVFSNAVQ